MLISISPSTLTDWRCSFPYLQLSEGETATSTNTAVVLDGRAADDWPQSVDWTRSDLGGLLVTGIAAALLATGLEDSKIKSEKS